MILDLFSELQLSEGMEEARVYSDAIEQAKLADELGYGCWWSVEHHCTGDFSHCSTPDMFLAVLSQQTERIHLGTAGTLAPFAIHHPLQIAERSAFLDVISGGRLELGLARSVSREWETFGVHGDSASEQVAEALRLIPRYWTEPPFAYHGKHLSIPPREVVPKPLQKPHPPLWVTTSSTDGFERAGRMGVGVLATLLLAPPENMSEAFAAYQRGLEDCDPVGSFVNDQRALFAFFHCAETRKEAIESEAAAAVLWFMNCQPEIYNVRRSDWIEAIRANSVSWVQGDERLLEPDEEQPEYDLDPNDPVPVISLMNRQLAGEKLDPVEAFEALEPYDAVLVGDVESCRRKIERLGALGLDRLMCLMQMGPLSHEVVMRSIRVTGEALIPEFAKRDREHGP
ncbi:MAG: LLM class flavin-dependent oxidoreductase [Deltaproteobacteria bacterium]|jgi:alkanesulfonate monooxygenase SsuD/methylene tetrahydromethanopterin reductase-like flavin-dependent oxidoreductase (luciferase family)|nr:LLM class flavin-dependent oxidoreductase [Deltaproteobacteria bacterium]MBW2499539.1 LLM class flavin-dependent oxidoreductase [Deltaproteobacteria bacterium]